MELKNLKYHNIDVGPIKICQICGSERFRVILDLGHQPLSNTVLTKEMLNEPEIYYPLRLVWCEDCSGVQVDYCVEKSYLYHKNYPYKTGATAELVDYFIRSSDELVSKYGLNSDSLVVEIGSNDGTFLEHFLTKNIKVVGVEPTDIAKIAMSKGVETIQNFFNPEIIKDLVSNYGKADMVLATNVFERISNMGEVISGIHSILKENGTFVLEFHSLLSIVTGGQFDAIYHEHLKIFSLKSLVKLFSFYDLSIVKVENGFGSRHNLKVYITKGKNPVIDESIHQFLKIEEDNNLHKYETYVKFSNRAKKTKRDFINKMVEIVNSRKTIVANSCPARLVAPINYFGAGADWIKYIAENPSSPKIGLFLPGSLIPVVSNQILLIEQPDYILLLAYNYADIIMKQLKSKGITSDFIIPLPDFKIIKNEDIII